MTSLFAPLELRGGLRLANRVVMAPMTRSRASREGVPSPFAAEYYAQRSTAGLIITEGVVISPQAKGYSLTPGLYNEEQAVVWSGIAEAVHRRTPGSKIFAQLWHVGRISNVAIAGLEPVAPSAVRPPLAKVWLQRPSDGWQGNVECSAPREMTRAAIRQTIADFRRSARLAVDAGIDGVEIHGANGYLIDQFMRATTNRRQDDYGGAVAGRLRFLKEVVEAVGAEVGADRTGIRLAPYIDFGDTHDPQIEDTILAAAEWLGQNKVSYLHVVESENQDLLADRLHGPRGQQVGQAFRERLRSSFTGPLILGYRYNGARAARTIQAGQADAIAFGRPYIANPDLVRRLELGIPLADSNTSTWYGGGRRGYTDYPTAEESGVEPVRD